MRLLQTDPLDVPRHREDDLAVQAPQGSLAACSLQELVHVDLRRLASDNVLQHCPPPPGWAIALPRGEELGQVREAADAGDLDGRDAIGLHSRARPRAHPLVVQLQCNIPRLSLGQPRERFGKRVCALLRDDGILPALRHSGSDPVQHHEESCGGGTSER
eukprot:709761-Pyramimonas_sp.AAC.1